jgi:hypothetical protein
MAYPHINSNETQCYNVIQINTTKSLVTYADSGSGRLHSIVFGTVSGSGANTAKLMLYDGEQSSSISYSYADVDVTKSYETLWNAVRDNSTLLGSIALDSAIAPSSMTFNYCYKKGLALRVIPTGSVDLTVIFEK